MTYTTLWTHPNFDGTLKLDHDGEILHRISYLHDDETCIDSPLPATLNPLIEWLNTYAVNPQAAGLVPWSSCPRILGTPFQESVWTALGHVQAGETVSYQELAVRSGHPARSARAVANAMAQNPFIILIPCHRVLRHSGELGGYSGYGGIERKRLLLKWEGVTSFLS